MRPRLGPNDHVVRLPDGRILGYAQIGDPNGVALINCHGGLTCRLDIASAASSARRAGICIISPDRPGIGLSTRQRGRSIVDWAHDVEALADQLQLDRFLVIGWSFGGPYAAAVAARLPERTSAAALVAGGVPLTWPCATKGFENRTDAMLFRLSKALPPLAATAIRTSGEIAALSPRLWLRFASREMVAADVQAIKRDGAQQFADSIAEGLRRPGGAIDDYLAYARPWGFEYEHIMVPVDVWQGEEDTLVPATWSEEASRRLPKATLTLVPGCGHFVARDNWDGIFSGLLRRL
jgi:pimeloyl-ACP methyl ester carboxylesterase